MDMRAIDLRTTRMQIEHSTILATSHNSYITKPIGPVINNSENEKLNSENERLSLLIMS